MKYQFLALLISFFFLTSQLLAQPTISDVSLRGLQIGATTDLTVSGQGLKKGSQIFFPFAVQQTTVSENGSSSLQLKITLQESIRPGVYPLRVINEDGLSNPILIGVDRLPHREFKTEKQELPVALTGNVVGARILKTSFEAKKDELVVLEVEANRLGAKLRPVVHLYDARGKQVAFGQPSRFLGGDSRCFLRIPADGEYFVELHDFLFRGASPGYFRLKLGNYQYSDLSLPIAVRSNQNTAVRMIKNDAESEFLTEIQLPQLGWWPAPLDEKLFSGFVPQVLSSDFNEYVEMAQSGEPVKAGTIPLGINGRLAKPREVDQYLIDVKGNSKLVFDLMGQRLGSPIDARIRVKNVAGNVLAQNDDRKGEQDAFLNYTVPGNVKQLIVEVSDVAAHGSKAHVYRLAIYAQNRPSVVATVDRATINVPSNGTTFVPVRIARTNYSGPVELDFQGLPRGYQVSGSVIPAGSDIGLVTLTGMQPEPAVFSISAITKSGEKVGRYDVLAPESPSSKGNEFQRKLLAIAPMPARKLDLDWKGVGPEFTAYLGGTLPTEIVLSRSKNMTGVVRVRLITNQKTPKKRVRKNNKDTFVDDIDKTIRAANVELAEGNATGKISLTIPNDIEAKTWEVLLVAEWLTNDKKSVLMTSSTRPVKLLTQRIADVQLEKGKLLTLPKNGTAELQLAGKIQRHGNSLPCRISLIGLPKGVNVSPIVIRGGQSAFQSTFKVPVNPELLKLKSVSIDYAFYEESDPNRVIGKAKSQKVKVKIAPDSGSKKVPAPAGKAKKK